MASGTSPHTVKPAHIMEKMPNLDGLRAFACLFVVVSHIPKSGFIGMIGAVGVGVFFTLSGFLMGYLYASKSCDPLRVKQYAIARFARIVPIYWLVISLCILISLFAAPDFPLRIDTLNSIIRHYALGGNVGPFWSIPLEIQYYVFFVFIWFCLSMYRKIPQLLWFAGLFCVALIATNDYWPNLSLPNKLHYFLAGTIAGMLPRDFWRAPERAGVLTILQGISVLAILFPLTQGHTIETFYDSIALSLIFAAAVYWLSFDSRASSALFASRPIRKIGHASFSIYLIHVLIIYYGGLMLGLDPKHFHPLWLVIAAVSTVIPMWVSQVIEMPLQRMTRDYLERIFIRKQPMPVQQTS